MWLNNKSSVFPGGWACLPPCFAEQQERENARFRTEQDSSILLNVWRRMERDGAGGSLGESKLP